MTDQNKTPVSAEQETLAALGAGGSGTNPISRHEEGLSSIAHKIFSFPALLGALLASAVMLGARANLPDPDLWWHLMVGRQILATHHWPTTDSFSFTVYGNAWIAFEWLGEVLMAAVERIGGLEALQAMLVGFTGALALLVYYYAYLRSRNWKASFVACFFTLLLATGFFTLRPQIMGYICLVGVLICLEKYRQGKAGALWFLPPIFLVWVNAHGSFVLGALALAIFLASGLTGFQMGGVVTERWSQNQRIRIESAGLLSLAALAMTPYGTRLAAYPLQMALSQPINIANVAEWQSIGFGEVWGKQVFALMFVFFLAVMIFRPRYRLDEILLLAFAIFLAFEHRRFFPFMAIVLAPMVAVLLSRWIPKYAASSDHYVLNAVLIAALLVGWVRLFPSRRDLDKAIASLYPQAALNYITGHPQPGRLFNEFLWGGYMIWKRGPQHKVFIDGRTDVYEYAGVFGDYLHIVQLNPQALFLLRKYDIGSALLTPDDPLGTLLNALPNWQRVYADDVCVLYARKSAAASPAPAKPGDSAPFSTSTDFHAEGSNFRPAQAVKW